jgi:SAM-dependent methyltransferase
MSETPGNPVRDENRRGGVEAGKTIDAKYRDGFIARYLSGPNILDIGYRGYTDDALPIVPQAIGIDLNYPGYDGKTLPFADNSQDAVFSSHCLEHIDDYRGALREWHRVLRMGGFMIVSVPHQFLYERRLSLPSRWNQDHKRFYTPASLLAEVESSLEPNTYRLRYLTDNDARFTYSSTPEVHPGGCYEIELVLEKIAEPAWKVSDLMHVHIGPESDQVEWIGFSPCEYGHRWTVGEHAELLLRLTADEAVAAKAPGCRILMTVGTFGTQHLRVSMNSVPVYEKTLIGIELVLDIPTNHLDSGLNRLEFHLPDATRPAGEDDPRRLGIAVKNIRLLRLPPHDAPARGKIRAWNAIMRLLGRA